MKISAVILLLIFSTAFASCGKVETLTNLTQQKIETENTENEQPDAPPILEITQEAKGMREIVGKTLFFNLYENGIIEFEYADEQKKTSGKINKAEEVNILKRAKISKEELQKFLDQLKTEDFQNLKDEYKRKCCCTDATVDFTIHYQNGGRQKDISLNGYCDIGEITNARAPNFPNVLYGLMILTDEVRRKYISQ